MVRGLSFRSSKRSTAGSEADENGKNEPQRRASGSGGASGTSGGAAKGGQSPQAGARNSPQAGAARTTSPHQQSRAIPPQAQGARASPVNMTRSPIGGAGFSPSSTSSRNRYHNEDQDDNQGTQMPWQDESGSPSKQFTELKSRARRFTHTFVRGGPSVEIHDGGLDDDFRSGTRGLMDDFDNIQAELKEQLDRMQEEEEEEAGSIASEDAEQTGPARSAFTTGSSKNSKKGQRKKKFEFSMASTFKLLAFKKGQQRLAYGSAWKLRFFEYRNPAELHYHENKKDGSFTPKGIIDLRGATPLFDEDYPPNLRPGKSNKRSNKEIQPELEFAIKDRSGRTWALCARNEVDYDIWRVHLTSLQREMEEHRMQNPRPNPNHKPNPSRAGSYLEESGDDAVAKWDAAQNWRAFGKGLYDGTVGQKVEFVVKAFDVNGSIDTRESGESLSVVVESEDLHYDLKPVDNNDGTFSVTFEPFRAGDYELSIMVDGYDIYGSPFHPTIRPGGASATNCVVEGTGIHFAVVDEEVNEFHILARDLFGEPLQETEDSVNFEVHMTDPLVLLGTEYVGDALYRVTYRVDKAKLEEARENGSDASPTVGILVPASGGELMARHVAGSPFSPVITDTCSPAEVAAAFAASEFSKLVAKNNNLMSNTLTLQLFTKLFKEHGIQQMLLADGAIPSPPRSRTGTKSSVPPAAENLDQQMNGEPQLQAVPAPQQQQGQATYLHAASPPPPSQQQQLLLPSVPSYFPLLATSSSPPVPAALQDSSLGRPEQQARGPARGWVPSNGSEAEMVRVSLEERARAIEKEKLELVRKRQELDESRSLIDEQVRHMQEIGRRVAKDSERVIEEARRVALESAGQPSPLRYRGAAAKPAQSPASAQQGGGRPNENLRYENGVAGRATKQASSPQNALMQSLPDNILADRGIVGMFEKHSVVLARVYEFYGFQHGSEGIQLSGALRMCEDYDIVPVFMNKRELAALFERVSYRAAGSGALSYDRFVELLATIACYSLSSQMFSHLYPTNVSRVDTMLRMWGVADPTKLSEIQQASIEKGIV